MLSVLNEQEKCAINRILKSHGFKLNGGSCEIRNGNIVYHLSIDKGCAATTGNALGKKLKQLLKADEVYDLGTKIA